MIVTEVRPPFPPAQPSRVDRWGWGQVYAAREEKSSGVSSEDLAALITGPPAVYVPSLVSLFITRHGRGERGVERGVVVWWAG